MCYCEGEGGWTKVKQCSQSEEWRTISEVQWCDSVQIKGQEKKGVKDCFLEHFGWMSITNGAGKIVRESSWI